MLFALDPALPISVACLHQVGIMMGHTTQIASWTVARGLGLGKSWNQVVSFDVPLGC